MMNKILLTFMLLLRATFGVLAQDILEVTGTISDAKNAPVVGVSISIKDAPGLGTTSDNKGNFKIKVERYKTLVFSSVGYVKQEILIKDSHAVNVTLKESETSVLEEVVVTGTGTQKRLTSTAATSSVDVNTMKGNPTSSLSNALAGNVPGVFDSRANLEKIFPNSGFGGYPRLGAVLLHWYWWTISNVILMT